jgi:beta-lactamase class A
MLPHLAGGAHSQVDRAVLAFAGDDPGRSVAVRSLRGSPVSAQIRAGVVRPAASLGKLALVAAVHSAAERGDVSLETRVERRLLGSTAYVSVLEALDAGHELSVRELCALCLITSDNPVANHLLELVGAEAVARNAHGLGCTDTHMCGGYTDADLASPCANLTTASDALVLVTELVANRPELARALINNLKNTRIPLRLPSTVRVAHKTGTLQGVANDAGVIFGQRTDLAVAFLCEGQTDIAHTSIEIGDCVAAIWTALGERVQEPVAVSAPPSLAQAAGARA